MRWLLVVILEAILVFGTIGADLEKITPWLININFILAIFSVNFTFFGHQLSTYKPLYRAVSNRQKFNIASLVVVPFIPMTTFLFVPEYFGQVALWMMPILMFSAFDNAAITARNLNPRQKISDLSSQGSINRYIKSLEGEVRHEVGVHEEFLRHKDKFQIPFHSYEFSPTTLGAEESDLWDAMHLIASLSIENRDYPVFRECLRAMVELLISMYAFKNSAKENDYRIESGIRVIGRLRFRSVMRSIRDQDEGGIFLETLSSELCKYLTSDDFVLESCSEVARAVASDSVWLGKVALESELIVEPMRILNALHQTLELSLDRMASSAGEQKSRTLDSYNVSFYVYDIRSLGEAALRNENSHFAYRCAETICFIGCNAAKSNSHQTLVASFESLVHIGRVARSLNIGCFWSRCLIPAESHVEEFIGHILTWLVRDWEPGKPFRMQGYAEQAYSRLRGYRCKVVPKPELNPCFWIEEIEEDGAKVPHVERESGMYGYGGECDYSEPSNLKIYVMHGIGPSSDVQIFHGAPVSIEPDDK